ncbi:MAG: hypothetical protein J0L88_15005 [Xanthomonadales bacterium]|nr:hypothetical protein [Xanthomonadales bacterium]
MIDAIRRNFADAVQLFVVPCLVALLPWRLGYACLRRMARGGHGLDAAAEAACAIARRYIAIDDEDAWKRRFRLFKLVERVDTWLLLLRPARWWRRQIDVAGSWPTSPGRHVLLTYHWGGGQWVFGPLREQGLAAHFIARRTEAADHGSGRIARGIATVRGRALARAGCLGVLFVGDGSRARIVEVLAQGDSVLGMLDLPARAQQAVFEGRLLDHAVRLPRGLLDIAAECQAPVLLLSCSVDTATGRRVLRLEHVPAGADESVIGAHYLCHLDARLREEPAIWHLWEAAPLMLVDADADVGEETGNAPAALQ